MTRPKASSIKALLHWRLLVLAAGFTGLVAGCGGGGGGGGGTAPPVPTRQTGEIEALGSVVVNGVRFHTGGAAITMDGQTTAGTNVEDKLKVGMVVDVEGTVNPDGVTGTATKVTFDDTLQGAVANPVTSANGTATFTVMGQDVVTVQDTEFSRAAGATGVGATPGLNDLVAGAEMEVSGGVDDAGRIVATHVQLKPVGAPSEITGLVAGAPPALTVAGVPVTLPVGTATPAAGSVVEVKGTFAGGTLTASTVEAKTAVANDDNFHFEGFVVSGDANSFTLSGNHLDQTLTVTTSGATVFAGGPKADLLIGTKVEVEGTKTGNAIAARKVKFRESVRLEILAGGATADPTSTIALRNLSAVTVEGNALTRVNDGSAAAGIGLNDQLVIRGRQSRDGTIIATRVDVADPRNGNLDRVILRGPVQSVVGSTVRLLGMDVNTAGVTVFRPNDDAATDTLTITREAFMAQVRTGTVVKVRGDLAVNNQFTATEMELEE